MGNTLARERAFLNSVDLHQATVNQNGQRLGAKGRRTRQRLIDATVDLLETRGLRDLTVAEVARTAETSPATFYVYFEGVPEVVLAALEHADLNQPELVDLLNRDWCGEGGLATAREFVRCYCAIWGSHRTVFRVRNLAAEEGDARFVAARVRSAEPIMAALAARAQAALQAGKVSPDLQPAATAGAILTLLERLSAVGPTTRNDHGLSFETLKESSAHMIAHVLGAA